MNSSIHQTPQDIDYQNLAKLWGNDISEIPLPVRDIIAGVLRKVREQKNVSENGELSKPRQA